jgi:diphosphomevalonate decarboxylase
MKATAIANSNIALTKYWGKFDWNRNVPSVGSISVTLDRLRTKTQVKFSKTLKHDLLVLNGGSAEGKQLRRVSDFLNVVRRMAGIEWKCEVTSENNFPTAAGLASSASAFASLALAATQAAGIRIHKDRLSALARLGSGSAARSIYGGYVELPAGSCSSEDPHAFQLANEHHWPINILVCVTSDSAKPVGSREAMCLTEAHSPFYQVWVNSSAADLELMRTAVRERDFDGVGSLAEHNALKLHALLMTSKPALIYWNQGTLAVIDQVRKMRTEKLPAYFTIDAGPQVKVVCQEKDSNIIADQLRRLPGVTSVVKTCPGPGARLVGDGP